MCYLIKKMKKKFYNIIIILNQLYMEEIRDLNIKELRLLKKNEKKNNKAKFENDEKEREQRLLYCAKNYFDKFVNDFLNDSNEIQRVIKELIDNNICIIKSLWNPKKGIKPLNYFKIHKFLYVIPKDKNKVLEGCILQCKYIRKQLVFLIKYPQKNKCILM